jgi:proteic killer suppression protein
VIRSFRCRETRRLFETGQSRRFSAILSVAERKLAQLNAAETLDFLRSPPGNRLEALKGDREGQYSMRINNQFRLCFRWTSEGPEDVEIVDYHEETGQ